MKNLLVTTVAIFEILIFFLINSCNEEKVILPIVKTTNVTAISSTTAVSGGFVTNAGADEVTSRGVCWNSSSNPTTANSVTVEPRGLGDYISNITNLTPNTKYFVRAYATNSSGTGYGNEVVFASNPVDVPLLSTIAFTLITQTSSVSGGKITNDNGASVSARGVCWGTEPTPTISNSKTLDGTGIGSFASSITGLASNTVYYVRAYATNNVGTAYGNELSFKTGTITDIDGNVYKTVAIGSQVWMAENLKTTKYRNGDLIGTTDPPDKDTSTETAPSYQWSYKGDESKVSTYGRLYTWYSVTDSRKLCPLGWHVPTDEEWMTLFTYLGGVAVAGGKMKETGTTHFQSPNLGATNESGFTALPAGDRINWGAFGNIGGSGQWWSASENIKGFAWKYYVIYLYMDVTRSNENERYGYSVRCLRDL